MNLGFPEMLFIFVLALLIFGPKKLPEIGRQVGKALAEFKRASNQFQAQLQVEIHDLERAEQEKQQTASAPETASPAGTVANTTVTPAVAAAAQSTSTSVPPPVSEAKPPDA